MKKVGRNQQNCLYRSLGTRRHIYKVLHCLPVCLKAVCLIFVHFPTMCKTGDVFSPVRGIYPCVWEGHLDGHFT